MSFEVAGPAAMFTRPDAGSTPISYPVPTASALKGMFEAVARKEGAFIRPVRVEICRPIRFERYVTNYGGPLRKPVQLRSDTNYQLVATILVDVRYRVFGVVERDPTRDVPGNAAHALQELFERRLRRGQSFYTPCLGWKEFVPTYFGELTDAEPCRDVKLVVPSLLHSVFDRPVRGSVRPTFLQNVEVKGGVIEYPEGSANA